MGIKSIILMTFLLSTTILNASNVYFNKLKITANLRKDEQLVVIYQQIGNCIKCGLIPLEKVADLKKSGRIKKIKIIALVRCDRDIELNIFKKQSNWQYFMYRDDGTSRKRLSISENSEIVVLDFQGKILFEF
jgi:hypothetical protein